MKYVTLHQPLKNYENIITVKYYDKKYHSV